MIVVVFGIGISTIFGYKSKENRTNLNCQRFSLFLFLSFSLSISFRALPNP